MLEVINLNYTYESKYQKVHALKNVNCKFLPGKFYAISGASGSGKSTLLMLLAGLMEVVEGDICFDEKKISDIGGDTYRREIVSVIFQQYNLFEKLSVLENVVLPATIAKLSTKKLIEERAIEKLNAVGIGSDKLKKLPNMLSGGERQRVAIARALTSKSKVILADEPTGSLDTENSEIVVNLLKRLTKEENCALIMVTHDERIVAQADVVYTMKDGVLTYEK